MAKDIQAVTDSNLILAAKNGKLEEVQKLLSQGDDVNYQDQDLRTALIWSIKNCHSNIAIELLKHNNIDVNLCGRQGHPALYWAIKNSDLIVTDKLLQNKALDLNLQDATKNNALHWALNKNLNILEELNSNLQDIARNTISRWSLSNNLTIIEKLLQKQSLDIDLKNIGGFSSFSLALALLTTNSKTYLDAEVDKLVLKNSAFICLLFMKYAHPQLLKCFEENSEIKRSIVSNIEDLVKENAINKTALLLFYERYLKNDVISTDLDKAITLEMHNILKEKSVEKEKSTKLVEFFEKFDQLVPDLKGVILSFLHLEDLVKISGDDNIATID